MFPNGDTLYKYVSMRQHAERADAARQRLATTAEDASGTRPAPVAVGEGLARMCDGVRAFARNAFAGQSETRPAGAARRPKAGAGIA
jgi:hypothetical protein